MENEVWMPYTYYTDASETVVRLERKDFDIKVVMRYALVFQSIMTNEPSNVIGDWSMRKAINKE